MMQTAAFDGRALPAKGEGRVRGKGPIAFEGHIVPSRYRLGKSREGLRKIPRGDAPANPRRPVLAVLACLAFAAGLYVQAGRWQDCRAEGGGVVACLLEH